MIQRIIKYGKAPLQVVRELFHCLLKETTRKGNYRKGSTIRVSNGKEQEHES